MNLREELSNLAVDLVNESECNQLFRKPIVGFSSANDSLYYQLKEIVGPEHLLPSDILPNAKTVISFFVPFTKEVALSNRKEGVASFEWAKSYIEANALINEISERMIKFLKDKEISAETIKATHTFDEKTLKSGWSHRSASYISGLGGFGVNRMLITPAGCAGRYGTVIMSQEVPADERVDAEFCTFYKNGKCLECIKACPVNALDIDGFDKFKCYDNLLVNSKEFTDIGFCDVCGKCIAFCPCAVK